MSGERDVALLDQPEGDLTRFDEALGNIRKLKERWHDRLTVERLAFPEDYLKGRVEFLFDFDISDLIRAFNYSGDVRPIFIRLKVCSPERDVFTVNRDIHASDAEKRHRWDEQFVFVHNVKIMQFADRVLPATVGFQLFDQTQRFGSGPLHLSMTPVPLGVRIAVAGFYEFLPIYSGWKIDVLRVPGSERAGCKDDSYIIKSRPDIMNGISQGSCKLNGHSIYGGECNFQLPRFRFADGAIIYTSAGQLFGRVCKLNKVSLGPFDL